MAIWTRFKSGYTASGSSLTVTFDEAAALSNTHTLVALIFLGSAASNINSTSWGTSFLAGSGNNGSVATVAAIVLQGDGTTNSLTINTTTSTYSIAVHLYAFPGFVSLTPHSGLGANGATVTTLATATTPASVQANTIALAGWALASNAGGWSGAFSNGFVSPLDTTDSKHMSAVHAYTATGATAFTSTSWTNARVARAGIWVLQGTSAGAGGDTTSPTVSFTAPADNATLSGTVTLSATATDNIGVASVRFYAGAQLLGNGVFSGGVWSLSANSNLVTDGVYLLRAVAADAAGNTTAQEITVTVQNTVAGPTKPLRLEGLDISKLYIGAEEVPRAYLGQQLVYGTVYAPHFGSPA